jgi:hypothetical protein
MGQITLQIFLSKLSLKSLGPFGPSASGGGLNIIYTVTLQCALCRPPEKILYSKAPPLS